MEDSRFIRTAGHGCIAGGLIAASGAIITATLPSAVPTTNVSSPYTPGVFRATEVLWTIAHLLMLIGTIGFARSGAVGSARLGRIGNGIAILGMALIVPCELGYAFFATAVEDSPGKKFLDSAIGMATMVAAIGFLLTGIAVLRAGRWQGWQRFVPLLCGAFVFVVVMPIVFTLPDLFLWPVAGWSACFVPLGIALYQQRPMQHPATLSAAPA
jgi:hypothetical protein